MNQVVRSWDLYSQLYITGWILWVAKSLAVLFRTVELCLERHKLLYRFWVHRKLHLLYSLSKVFRIGPKHTSTMSLPLATADRCPWSVPGVSTERSPTWNQRARICDLGIRCMRALLTQSDLYGRRCARRPIRNDERELALKVPLRSRCDARLRNLRIWLAILCKNECDFWTSSSVQDNSWA